jgi:hypothetical protein
MSKPKVNGNTAPLLFREPVSINSRESLDQ